MAKKVFTDESLATFVDEIKLYTDDAVSKKANSSHTHTISNINNLQTTLDDKAECATPVTDDSVAHIKDVPLNALPYAEVAKVGGMTYKTKNLWRYESSVDIYGSSVTVTKIDTGIRLTMNYVSAYQYRAFRVLPISVVDGKTITMSAKPIASGNSVPGIFLGYCNADGSVRNELTSASQGAGYCATLAIDSTSEKAQGCEYLYFLLYSNCGGTDATVGDYIDYTEIQIEIGNTKTDYEPYFEGLRSAPVTAVESVGVNLIPFPYLVSEVEANGVKLMVNADQSISAVGTSTAATAVSIQDMTLSAGTYSALWHGNIPSGGAGVQVMYRVDGGVGGEIVFLNTNAARTFTLSAQTDIRLRFYFGANVVLNNSFSIMLKKGNTAPYAPYTKTTFFIPEAVQALDGYGDGVSADCYNYIDWERKQFVKRVAKYVITETTPLKTPNNSANYQNAAGLYVYMIENKAVPYLWNADIPILTSDFLYQGNISGTANVVNKSGPVGSMYLHKYGSAKDYTVYFISDKSTTAEALTSLIGKSFIFVLETPEIIDIPHLLPDGCVGVEANGIVTMVNEYGYDVPSTVTYYEGTNEVIGAETIVGNLVGNAATATNAEMLGGKSADDFYKKTDFGSATTSKAGLMSPEDKAKLDGMSGSSSLPYAYGTEDLVAGTSPLETGKLYFVYE